MRRLLVACLVAVALAVPGIIIHQRLAGGCAPQGCSAWDIYDYQWWYFECYLPPCAGGQIT